MSVRYVKKSSEATNGEGWTPDYASKSIGKKILKDGVKYQIVGREEQQTSMIKRIGVFALTCLTLGLVLIDDSMRSVLFGKVVDFAVPTAQLETENKKALEAEKQRVDDYYMNRRIKLGLPATKKEFDARL